MNACLGGDVLSAVGAGTSVVQQRANSSEVQLEGQWASLDVPGLESDWHAAQSSWDAQPCVDLDAAAPGCRGGQD